MNVLPLRSLLVWAAQVAGLVVVALVAGGCGGSAKRASDFFHDMRGYNDGIRWRNHQQALTRIPHAERDDFLDERYELEEELRIGDYEVVRVKFASDQKAEVQVRYSWHLDSRGIVHTTTTRQQWERRGKQWWMVEEVRVRGETMPGVADEFDDESATEITDVEAAPSGRRAAVRD